MKQAVLVVSFGTTHLDTLEKTICAVERDVAEACGEIPCFRAFTSSIVRKRLLASSGIQVDSVAEALEKLSARGFTHVILLPTLLLPGEEFDLIRAEALAAAGNMQIAIGLPLLWDDRDLLAMTQALQEIYPQPEDTVLLAMGHGTSHAADSIYTRLRSCMNNSGMELCTVEGSIDFDAAVENMLARPQRKAHLVPLLLVAGDHSKNDMAGEESGSLKSRLTAAGFQVSCSVCGLGEIPAIRKAFVDRLLAML